MNAATIFKTLTTVTLSITLLMTGGCNNMETKKEETGKNTAIENIFARKSVRAYTSQPIEKEKVDLLVKAAMAAPTAVNKQPWAFVVVDDRTVLDKLAAELPYAKMTAQAPLAIVVCGDLSKALNGEKDRYWMLDCSAASENLLLAAESMGVGSGMDCGLSGERPHCKGKVSLIFTRPYHSFQFDSSGLSTTSGRI